jgi:hypothetical protein
MFARQSAVMKATVEPDAPPENDLDRGPPPVVRPARDYSQRPQRPIKLKPGIAREQVGTLPHAGPPREILERELPPPPVVAGPAGSVAAGLPQPIQDSIVRSAAAAGLSATEWVDQATRALAVQESLQGPVSHEEVILYTLREMNQRLAALERPRGLMQWLRRVIFRRG